MSEKLVLVDGHSILNRAFYGVPELTNASGLHTNAVYGFLNILFKILEEEQPQYLTVAFDLKAPTFRHQMYDAYKGTRKAMPDELREQVPIIKEVLQAMQIQIVTMEGYEADDLLGTMARIGEEQGLDVAVISGDRDLLQLATDHVKIRIPKTKRTGTEIEDYLQKDVIEKYQVTPTEFIDVKALMGDTADNIPGVPGIGEKTATKLIVQYHSVEQVYEHLEEMKAGRIRTNLTENRELATLSRKLAQICTTVPLGDSFELAKVENFYTEKAYDWFQKLEFKNMLQRFEHQETKSVVMEKVVQVDDLTKAEEIFLKAAQAERTALYPVLDQNELLGVALTFDADQLYFIQCGGFMQQDYLLDKCQTIIRQTRQIVVMDLKETLSILPMIQESENLKKVQDIGILAYLINPLKNSYEHEELAKEYLGQYLKSRVELLGKTALKQAVEIMPGQFLEYVCGIVYTSWKVEPVLMEKLLSMQMKQLYDEIERPLAVTLFHMEQEGIIADQAALEQYAKQLGERIEILQKQIYQLTECEFNINSPKQLGEILFEKLQLKNGKKTKTGYSTSAEVLEKLKDEHPVIELILEYRQLTKLKSTYADGLVQYIQEDQRIHSSFQQKVTATGRISSTEPNLQNIPIRMELGRLIRKVFVAKEGSVFIDADYSQIELRVLAHMSGDEKLIEAYNQNQDIHRLTASEVFHIPFDEVTSLQRRNAKAVNFGIVYGISSFGLSQDLSISRKEAADYIEKYFATYPNVKTYLDRLVEEGKEKGYAVTMFGRQRPIPELKSSNFMTRSFGERVAMNSPIQGTAADIIKIAMIRVDMRLRDEGLAARLLLQVHDELLIEAPIEETKLVCEILEEEMMQAASLKVKLEIDMHTGKDWYEAK